jgi:hypothetical protein
VLTANVNGLGDIRADLIKYLGPIVGNSAVANAYDTAVRTIRAEAEAGARAGVKKEIPVIEKKVRAEAEKAARAGVKPMVIGAVTASGVAAALGIAAFVIAITR